jgi:hypothetical protein
MKKGLGYEGLGLKVAKDTFLSPTSYRHPFAEGGERRD